ncbi:energy-coupling factor transporter ATP-binding protein EcfA2 [Catenibacillus scindens]|uniref:Energy-coupling factor transporter ATP-binding protein EcfA2 n=1 Tax=Catenibacillus scindens TaxID=673271 RepID=A0A7W8H8E2_9FIRM|nr:ATP-binding cassette domain-containing protein [Catenibacillus scindens]MBB5263761.1 energy-coupling factor transporter ATP-binding protein EcfA2 [Catenibacillus scindens]
MAGPGKKHTLRFDPRTELLLLVLANIVAFTQHNLWVEITWVVFLLLLIVACGCQKSAGKLAIAFGICLALQYYVFPNGPQILASSFTIIVSYARKIFPCLIVGTMVLQKTPVRELMVALRKWHIPQGLMDEQRIRMGLRSLVHPVLELPPADPPGAQEGLSVENLSCAFDKQPVFGGIGFSAKRGEVLGIVGHNGAGKTTMTRCLCGLVKEVNGTVRLDGQTLKAKQRNKASFCVMQDVNHQLFSDSVWNECELAQPDCPAERIEEILRSFDLLDFKDRHPMALSGGQKQRLAVATAILSNKDVLVFDEPTSGLDYHRMLEVSNMIRKLNDENKVIIIVSHDFEFLGRTCDKIFDMEGCSKERR